MPDAMIKRMRKEQKHEFGYGKDSHTYRVFNTYHNKVVETIDVRFDETNGSQREQLPHVLLVRTLSYGEDL